MKVKLTTAFVAATALLSSAAEAQLQCRLWTSGSNIISVDAFSASDLASKYSETDDSNWADVTLTGLYHVYAALQ